MALRLDHLVNLRKTKVSIRYVAPEWHVKNYLHHYRDFFHISKDDTKLEVLSNQSY